MIRSLNHLGELYRKLDEHDQAISYYDDGLAIAIAEQDSFALPMLLSNKGISLTQLTRFDEAFKALNVAHFHFNSQILPLNFGSLKS